MRKHLLAIIGLTMLLIVSVFPVACIQGTAPGPISTPAASSETTPINPQWTPPTEAQQPALPSISEVVAKVKPLVVAINVEITTYDIFNQPVTQRGAGSGWIIDKDGYVVTNNHVVEGAQNITVTLDDGRAFTARQVRTDPLTDVAMVKIDAYDLPAASIGDSSKIVIGDWVVAVGNALGMGTSATAGVVSAVNVSLSASPGQTLHGLIQTDAAINPGNSGGPLVNVAGEVIGINSIKIAQVGVENMGYAISINEAMPIIKELIEVGYVVRPWLGVELVTVNAAIASWYNLSVDKGVLLTNVVSGSPAEQAGLKAGDIITAIGGSEINDADQMQQVMNSYKIGQDTEITFWRGETKNTVHAKLVESPPPKYGG